MPSLVSLIHFSGLERPSEPEIRMVKVGVVVVLNVAFWGCLMKLGEELKLLLHDLDSSVVVLLLLLIIVLSGMDSSDETIGNGHEGGNVNVWLP